MEGWWGGGTSPDKLCCTASHNTESKAKYGLGSLIVRIGNTWLFRMLALEERMSSGRVLAPDYVFFNLHVCPESLDLMPEAVQVLLL